MQSWTVLLSQYTFSSKTSSVKIKSHRLRTKSITHRSIYIYIYYGYGQEHLIFLYICQCHYCWFWGQSQLPITINLMQSEDKLELVMESFELFWICAWTHLFGEWKQLKVEKKKFVIYIYIKKNLLLTGLFVGPSSIPLYYRWPTDKNYFVGNRKTRCMQVHIP